MGGGTGRQERQQETFEHSGHKGERTFGARVATAGEPAPGRKRREARAGSGHSCPPTPRSNCPRVAGTGLGVQTGTSLPWGLDMFGQGWPGHRRGAATASQEG